jgi:hypothetical protein
MTTKVEDKTYHRNEIIFISAEIFPGKISYLDSVKLGHKL